MFNKVRILKNQRGSIAATFAIILTILTSVLLYSASASLANKIGIERSVNNALAMGIAEGGAEKALWKLKQGSYTGETESSDIPGGQFDVAVSVSGNERTITVVSYVPSKASPKYKKSVKVKVTDEPTTENASFNYAIQAGAGGIDVGGSSEVHGNLYSNGGISVTGSKAEVHDPGDAWAVATITDPLGGIKGAKHPGAAPATLPTLNIESWKNMAKAGGTITGDYSPPATGTFTDLGPTEITGSVSMSNGQRKVNVMGPIYIHGDLTITGGEWKLDDSFGTNSTIVLVDGTISVNGGGFFKNASGGYLLFVSTNTASTRNSPAINFVGNPGGDNLALYAYNGAMRLTGSGKIIAMTGQTLFIDGSGVIDYDEGLASTVFSGGPGGTWNVIEWQEIKAP